MPPEKPQWAELFKEVVTSGLCTGCAACVIVCPHNVLDYHAKDSSYRPFHVPEDGGPEDCTHGIKGCTSCTRACPRFRSWEDEIETFMFQRLRNTEEVEGISTEIVLARAKDSELLEVGQDGGLVSAILSFALDEGIIDGALVSGLKGDGSTWEAEPKVVRNRQEIIETAGSRYTYSTNMLAYDQAIELGLEKLALVGTGCQTSAPKAMAAKKAGKVGRRFVLSIGLLCSKTFDDSIFKELFYNKYGIETSNIKKMNIKGVFQIWCHDNTYYEIPLKEAHGWTREGCLHCPDFAAEHADISAGGIGKFSDWTLTLIRTELGKEIIDTMKDKELIEVRPCDEDPDAIDLMRKLSRVSRKRWPTFAVSGPERR